MTAARRKVGFGIIGGGLMGREMASAIARWRHLMDVDIRPELAAVCDAAPAALEWFTARFEGIEATTDHRRLLESPRVDAVYCAVPHHLHQSIYVDILRAGKHLLAEKPVGIDQDANRAILAAAERRPDLVVRASSEFPFFPAVQRIVSLLREERFGTILEAECGFLHSSDMEASKPANWKRRAETNGAYGCMGDLGLHVFHVPLWAGWQVRNVRAILSNVVTQRPDAAGRLVDCDTWDNATLLCETAWKGQAFPLTAKMQRLAPGQTNTWYLSILGTEFSARFSTRHPKTLETLAYVKGRPQAWQSEDVGYECLFPAVTGGIFEFGFSDAVLQMLAAFCREVHRGGREELPFGCATLEITRQTHEVFTAALESHEKRSVVALK